MSNKRKVARAMRGFRLYLIDNNSYLQDKRDVDALTQNGTKIIQGTTRYPGGKLGCVSLALLKQVMQEHGIVAGDGDNHWERIGWISQYE